MKLQKCYTSYQTFRSAHMFKHRATGVCNIMSNNTASFFQVELNNIFC